MPSVPGIRMSRQATSGASSRASVRASSPSAAVADHLDVVLGVEQGRQPGAHQRLVVGDEHADHRTASCCSASGAAAGAPAAPTVLGDREVHPPAAVGRRRRSTSVAPIRSARSRMPTRPKPRRRSALTVPGGALRDRHDQGRWACGRRSRRRPRRRGRGGRRWPATPAPSGTRRAARAGRRRRRAAPRRRRGTAARPGCPRRASWRPARAARRATCTARVASASSRSSPTRRRRSSSTAVLCPRT